MIDRSRTQNGENSSFSDAVFFGRVALNGSTACKRCGERSKSASFATRDDGKKDPVCKQCRRDAADLPGLDPSIQRTLSALYRSSKARFNQARFGDVKSDLKIAHLGAMWRRQGGICALSGVPLECGKAGMGCMAAPSIDRIDSKIGYLFANTHLVCVRVNLMKGDLSVAEFRDWCARVGNSVSAT